MGAKDKYAKLYAFKVFCMMPWIHTHVWPSGKAFPCCMSDSTVEYGNLNDNSLAEIWNNDKYRQLRKNMLNDDEIRLKFLLKKHVFYTDSSKAKNILENWDKLSRNFVKITPLDFKRVLLEKEKK